ncbi:MAG: hypothetical protein RIQ52_787 [Pseudomonadota bacterium]
MMRKAQLAFDYFLIGVLGLLPVVLISQLVLYVEELLRAFIVEMYTLSESFLMTTTLFLVTLGFFIWFGYLLKNDKAYLVYYIESLIQRIPVLSTIYRVSKKLLSLFSGHDDEEPNEVVYVEYPKDDMWVPGYVTNHTGEYCVIYIPTSPNPTSGFTVLVHESRVKRTKQSMEQVSSFIISLGSDYPGKEEMPALLGKTGHDDT